MLNWRQREKKFKRDVRERTDESGINTITMVCSKGNQVPDERHSSAH